MDMNYDDYSNVIIFSSINDDANINYRFKSKNYSDSGYFFSGTMSVPSNLNYSYYYYFAFFFLSIGLLIILFRKKICF